MKGKVTITDIARASGVSITTVSFVLNDRLGVSQETRARVLLAASELGYLPAPGNSSKVEPQKSRSLSTIGMIVKTEPDLPPQANPFYSKVMLGIEDVCRRDGIDVLFATLPVDENNRPVEPPRLLFNNSVDGLLLIGAFVDPAVAALLSQRQVPIVLVDSYSDTERYDTVVSDNFRAAYQAIEYLLSKGHRQIGLVGGDNSSYPSLRERRNGYLRALKENYVAEAYSADFNIRKSHGYDETLSLLTECPQITALFCVNDEVASAAARAAQTLGRRIPTDLSIVGYDDTYLSAHAYPALSTMHVDTLAMGRAAVRLLALRLENPETARMTLTIHPWLIERQSVGSPLSAPS